MREKNAHIDGLGHIVLLTRMCLAILGSLVEHASVNRRETVSQTHLRSRSQACAFEK
jgi:hypothetical protein